MHDTAYEHGRLFFELYAAGTVRTLVELGSQDINGSLREVCPPDTHYIGLDIIVAEGVDVVVKPGAPLPLAAESADAVLASSVFEHDVCFWETFLELTRILRPGGLLYLNSPANSDFHRHPLDCWRFYPDAGLALVQWAARHDIHMELIESFIGLPQAQRWADFVAVFRKAGGPPLNAKGRIAGHAPGINIHHRDLPPGDKLENQSASMPDTIIAGLLQAELAAAQQDNATLAASLDTTRQTGETLAADLAATASELKAERERNENLACDLAATRERVAGLLDHLETARNRIDELEHAVASVRCDLAALQRSTSWRLTAPLRSLMILVRGR